MAVLAAFFLILARPADSIADTASPVEAFEEMETAPGPPQDDEIHPLELAEYAKDYGVGTGAAEEALKIQQAGSGIVQGLEAVEGGDYSGIWFDNQRKEFVVPLANPAKKSDVIELLDGLGVIGNSRIVSASYTWDELEKAQSELDHKLMPLINETQARTSIDTPANAIEVTLAQIASGERAEVKSEAENSAVPVELNSVATTDVGIENTSCQFEFKRCTAPLRGGVGIKKGGAGWGPECTAAFKAIGNDLGHRFMLTAGHCVLEGTQIFKWYAELPNNEEPAIGLAEGSTWPGGDWSAINATKSYWDTTGSWPSEVAFWEHGEAAQETSITGESGSYIGELVCHSGYTSGGHCGTVVKQNVTAETEAGPQYHLAIFGPTCVAGGDSGGPVFAGNVALGIFSAELHPTKACGEQYGLYAEIVEADDALAVTVGPRIGTAPYAESEPATGITGFSATMNGYTNPHGIATYVHWEYGPTIGYGSSSATGEAGSGWSELPVTGAISNLVPVTTYHFRLVASNAAGTAYGIDEHFTTPPAAPRAITEPATNVKKAKATLNASVNPDGAETDYHFEWGTTTAYGSSSTPTVLGSGNTFSSVSLPVGELKEETVYHYRVVAHNSLGTVYGADREFKEPRLRPLSVTLAATNAGETAVTLRGTVNPDESDTHYQFEYGSTSSYGTAIPIPSKDIGEGVTPLEQTQLITGLKARATYHYRITASNSFGSAAGADQIFTPGWVLQSPLVPEGSKKTFFSNVSCVSPSYCEAVGRTVTPGGQEYSLAELWNGEKWAIQSVPNPAGTVSFSWLINVSCKATTFCEATGFYVNGTGETLPFAAGWNGAKWTVQSMPSASKSSNYPYGVSCASSTSCEAVGYGFVGSSNGSEAWHWNGTKWEQETMPLVSGATETFLFAASCTSTTLCEAAGEYRTKTGAYATLAERWSSGKWEVQTTPNEAGAKWGAFRGISCVSSTFCEATGDSETSGSKIVTLAEKWNGSSWTLQSTPNPESALESNLFSVSCETSTSCEATGLFQDSATQWITYAEHWDGTKWEAQSPPHPEGARYSIMQGVSCVSAVCEAVGYQESLAGGPFYPLAEHY